MNDYSPGLSTLTESLLDSMRSLIEHLPVLGIALLVLAGGWLVSRVLRATCIRLGQTLNTWMARLSRTASAQTLHLSANLIAVLGDIVFWVAILIFAAIASRIAGLHIFAGWLEAMIAYLPALAAGGLIILAGYLISRVVRDSVSRALAAADSAQHELLAALAQGAVFLTALVIGLDQIGIDVTLLIILFAILVSGLLLSLSMAFGLGARDFVGNLIAANQLQRTVQLGENVRMGEVAGRVLEISHTSVVLLNEHGRLFIPAKYFQEQMVLVEVEDDDD